MDLRVQEEQQTNIFRISTITNSNEGEGLLFFGNTIVPFIDKFPKDTILYQKMTTKPEEVR